MEQVFWELTTNWFVVWIRILGQILVCQSLLRSWPLVVIEFKHSLKQGNG